MGHDLPMAPAPALCPEAGAVVSAEQGEQALRAAAEPGTAALIQALLGHQVTDTAALEDALTDLTLDARLTADRILEDLQAATEKAAAASAAAAAAASPAAAAATAVPAAPELAPGPKMPRRKGGLLYEVLHKAVAIRYLPSTTADMVGTRILGQMVELFEASADQRWRKMEDPESGEEGWMLLQHPQLGALLRPVSEDRLE
ncbi:unnamed protein product [Effrenium voratum]|nr:unnamed protein product [Effrenium voratum]